MKTIVYLTVFFILIAVAWNAFDFLDPFGRGLRNSSAAFFGYVAKQSIEHGTLLPLIALEDDHPHYYLRHMPLIPWLTYLGFLILGTSEWCVRLTGLVFCAGWMSLLVWMASRWWSTRHALAVSIILAAVPLSAFYGSIIPDSASLLAVLLNLWCYYRFLETNHRKYWAGLIATLILGSLCYWHVFYLVPLYFLHGLKERAGRKILLWYPLLAFSILVFWFAIVNLSRSAETDLGLVRMVLFVIPPPFLWLATVGGHVLKLVTIPILALSLYGLIVNRAPRYPLIMLGLYGLMHAILFRIHLLTHDHFLLHLLPFIALTAGCGAIHLLDALGNRKILKVLLAGCCVAVLAFCAQTNITLYGRMKTDKYERQGRAIKKKVPEGTLIYRRGLLPQVLFYTDRTLDAKKFIENQNMQWKKAIELYGIRFF